MIRSNSLKYHISTFLTDSTCRCPISSLNNFLIATQRAGKENTEEPAQESNSDH